MLKFFFRGKPAAILLVIAFGVLRLPLESAVTERQEELGMRSGRVDLTLRDQISQEALAGTFTGFRSLVASVVSVTIISDWRGLRWDDVEKKHRFITQLQPRVDYYWYSAFTHLSHDANSYFRYDRQVYSPDDPDEPITNDERKHYAGLYLKKGIGFLEEGIRNNPTSSDLHLAAGRLYQDHHRNYLDAEKAAMHFKAAAESPTAPGFARRFHAYALSEVPGREREAYAFLMELFFENKRQRKPTLVIRIRVLEEILGIPVSERVPLGIDKNLLYHEFKRYYPPIRLSEDPDAILKVIREVEDDLEIPEQNRVKSRR